MSNDSTRRLATRYLESARPISLDKGQIRKLVDSFMIEMARFMSSRKEADTPLHKQVSSLKNLFRFGGAPGERSFKTTNVKGQPVSVPLLVDAVIPKQKNLTRLFIAGGAIRTMYADKKDYGHPYSLTIRLDATVPPGAWLDRLNKKTIAKELFSVLIHEITHVRDLLPHHEAEDTDSDEGIRNYYNRPIEVRAFMQQVVDEVLQDMEEGAKKSEGWSLDTSHEFIEGRLERSPTWRRVRRELTAESRKLILKAVARAVTDAYPDLLKRYFKEASSRLASLHLARVELFDASRIEKLRKDFLMLMKNVAVVRDYDQAVKWADAVIRWRQHFELVVLERLRTSIKDLPLQHPSISRSDVSYWDKKIGSEVWDLYIEFKVPLERYEYAVKNHPGTTKEGLFQKMKQEIPKWKPRVERGARKAWKILKEFEAWHKRFSPNSIEVEVPVEERASMEGFSVVIKGYREGESHSDYLAQFREGLRLYKRRAQQVLPLLIRAQLPLILDFNLGLDLGGTYGGDNIKVNPVMSDDNPGRTAQVIAHEMGHHLYKHYLSKEDQKFWSSAISGNYGTLDLREVLRKYGQTDNGSFVFNRVIKQEDPLLYLQIDGLLSEPEAKQVFEKGNIFSMKALREYLEEGGQAKWVVHGKPISGYAHKNHEEAFCEAVGILVGYGPQTVLPEVREWLKTILPQIKVSRGMLLKQQEQVPDVLYRADEDEEEASFEKTGPLPLSLRQAGVLAYPPKMAEEIFAWIKPIYASAVASHARLLVLLNKQRSTEASDPKKAKWYADAIPQLKEVLAETKKDGAKGKPTKKEITYFWTVDATGLPKHYPIDFMLEHFKQIWVKVELLSKPLQTGDALAAWNDRRRELRVLIYPNRLAVSVSEYRHRLLWIEKAVRHELQHFMQFVLTSYQGVRVEQSPGWTKKTPSEKKLWKMRLKGLPASPSEQLKLPKTEQYFMDPREFMTWVEQSEQEFLDALEGSRNESGGPLKPTKEEFNRFVGNPRPVAESAQGPHTHQFFATLWKHDKERWRRAVSEVWKRVQNKVASGAAHRIAALFEAKARYKNKKKVKTEDGDEATVYEYSERQVSNRNNEKAKRVQKLRGMRSDLLTKAKKDLDSEDPKIQLAALAVLVIDETYERPGNEESAKEGHFGVTGLRKKHVTFKGGKAHFSYVGKSGVKQNKTLSNGKVVTLLKKLSEGKKDSDALFSCAGEDGDFCLSAKEINAYLPEGITAKDLRGLHANEEMLERLKAERAKGKELPSDRKEKDKILKAEFNRALEGTAEAVGHEPSTLRSQYLVPALEEAYLHDGTVIKKFTKESSGRLTDTGQKTWSGGTVWRMNVRNDKFVHFTTPDRARIIVEAGKLLMRPPYPKFGTDAVNAISLVYGDYVPGTQTKHVKGGELVGVVFQTNLAPDSGYVEEVSWHRDVPLQNAIVVDAPKAVALLRAASHKITDEDMVTYEGKTAFTETERVILASTKIKPVLVSLHRDTWKALAPNLWRVASKQPQAPRPVVPGVQFDEELFVALWYEDGEGNKRFVDWEANEPDLGALGEYQHSLFPNELTHNILRIDEHGSTEVARGGSTYSNDLVTQMVRSKDWNVCDAIMVAGQTCSRCMNVLRHHYGLDGYPFGSESYWRSGTRCSMCEHVDNSPESSLRKKATKSVSEREDEAVRDMLKKEPKKKPPRQDLRKHRLDNADADLEGGSAEEDKDLSLNFKRVAARFLHLATDKAKTEDAARTMHEKYKEENPGTKKTWQDFYEEPAEEGSHEEDASKPRGKKKPPKSDAPMSPEEEEAAQAVAHRKLVKDTLSKVKKQLQTSVQGAKLPASIRGDLATALEDMEPDQVEAFAEAFAEFSQRTKALPLDGRNAIEKAERSLEELKSLTFSDILDPNELAQHVAEYSHAQHVVDTDKKKQKGNAKKVTDALSGLEEHIKGQTGDDRYVLPRVIKKVLQEEMKDLAEEEHSEFIDAIKDELKSLESGDFDTEEAFTHAKETLDELEGELKDLSNPTAKGGQVAEALRAQRVVERYESRKKETDKAQKRVLKELEDMFGQKLPKELRGQVEETLEGFEVDEKDKFLSEVSKELKAIEDQIEQDPETGLAAMPSDLTAELAEALTVSEFEKDSESLGKAVARAMAARKMVADPLNLGGEAVSNTKKDVLKLKARGTQAFEQYRSLPPEIQEEAAKQVNDRLAKVDPESPEAKELNRILDGIFLAAIAQSEEGKLPRIPGREVNEGFAELAKALVKEGRVDLLLGPAEDFLSSEGRHAVSTAMASLSDEGLAKAVGSTFPEARKYLVDDETEMPEARKALLRNTFIDMAVDNMAVVDRLIKSRLKEIGDTEFDDPDYRATKLSKARKRLGKRFWEDLFGKWFGSTRNFSDSQEGTSELPRGNGEQGKANKIFRQGAEIHDPNIGMRFDLLKALSEALTEEVGKVSDSHADRALSFFLETANPEYLRADPETPEEPEKNPSVSRIARFYLDSDPLLRAGQHSVHAAGPISR